MTGWKLADDIDDLLIECTLCGRLTRGWHGKRACRPREHRYHDDRQRRYELESA